MIASLTGTVAHIDLNSVIIAVGGVGFRVFVSTDTFGKLSGTAKTTPVTLLTHLAVRENALDLYGFLAEDELRLFERLITVSGVGPKSAIAILSLATVPTLQTAIATKDAGYLTKVSGIGKKTAEKIIVELHDKVVAPESVDHDLRGDTDIIEALQSLGYGSREAQEAVKKVSPHVSGTSARVREALKILSGKKE